MHSAAGIIPQATSSSNTLFPLICKVPQENSTRSLRLRMLFGLHPWTDLVKQDRRQMRVSQIGLGTIPSRGSSIAFVVSLPQRGSPEFSTSFAIRPSILDSLSLTMVTVRLCSRARRAALCFHSVEGKCCQIKLHKTSSGWSRSVTARQYRCLLALLP